MSHLLEGISKKDFQCLILQSKYSLLFSSNVFILKITNTQKNFKNDILFDLDSPIVKTLPHLLYLSLSTYTYIK